MSAREHVGHRYDLRISAHRTRWGLRFYMLIVASLMYGMSTWHENDSLWGCKEVFTADRTVAFGITFNAAM